ncbi:MAG: YitT family protein [Lachnospiraceae bacterium]
MPQLKNQIWRRRLFAMLSGIIIMGLGVSLFKLSLMGNDPHSAMVMAIGDSIGLSFSAMLIIINSVWFILEICLNHKLIGIGTFFNWFCVGIFTDMWTDILTSHLTFSPHLASRLFVMFIGVIILSFSAALYQTADLGIAPYDALSLIMSEHLPLPYFWCRIITDSACAAVTFLFGGIVGLGTLFCAFGLGPFINIFTKTVARKLCGHPEKLAKAAF